MTSEEQIRERTEDLVRRHGEVVRKTYAAREILNCCIEKVNAMLEDGRLDYACGGTMVDVYSIARYICQPKAEDFKARREKAIQKSGCRWRV